MACDIINVFSDLGEGSAVVNRNMPVLIQFGTNEDDNISEVIFNYQMLSVVIPVDGVDRKKSYLLKKELDKSYAYNVGVYTSIDLDKIVENAIKNVAKEIRINTKVENNMKEESKNV